VFYSQLKNRSTIPIIKATFAVVVWGASFVATKVALRDISPVSIVWLRFAIGFMILGFAVLARNQFSLPTWHDLAYFALLGFIGITFHQWLQSTGLVTAQAITTGWIVASTPIFMALLGWLMLREQLQTRQVLGILLAAFGVLLVISKGDFSSFFKGGSVSSGDFLIMLSAPNWAIFSILSRRMLQEHPATRMMFYVMGFGWLFTSILFFTGQELSHFSRLTWNGWLGVLFLGVFCSGLAYIFWYEALKVLPASQTGSFLYIEPIVTVVVANILLSEPLIGTVLVGGLIILLGVWFVNNSTSLPDHPSTRSKQLEEE
jgi:drug/metabolite transporter (DMT)-like permease